MVGGLSSQRWLLTLGALAVALIATGAALGPGTRPASATPCSPARPHASGTSSDELVTPSGLRTFRLHVPPSYTGGQAVPLILDFHGLGSNGGQEELLSGLSDLADAPEGGFIVAYPDGTLTSAPGSTSLHWNTTQLPSPEPDDVAFVDQVITALETDLCIDASRVFAAGMSNGAMMSTRLACSLSSRIAAIAPVAGAYYPPLLDSTPNETCPDTRPVPFIAFHGTADLVVPFNGGIGLFSLFFRLAIDNTTSDPDVIESWAAHNGCTSGRQTAQVTPNVVLVEYSGCAAGASVQLYRVEGGDHYWPGSAYQAPSTTTEIDATGLMWAFFQQHPLGPKPAPPPTPTPKDPDADSDGDTLVNSDDTDDDNDGCLDTAETQYAWGSERSGGRRDPHSFWDFYDVWTRPSPSSPWTRDRAVTVVGDILGVARRFGAGRPGGAPTKGTALAEALVAPASDLGYHTAFDRGPLVGPNIWNSGPPDGGISVVVDVLQVARQYGHSCL